MINRISDLFLRSAGYGYFEIMFLLFISCIVSAYIFIVYRATTKTVFFSKTYSIAIGVVGIIVTAIILAMQNSLAISLGMVGALSIIRYRTAIKDPMDLVFLFWAVGEGIMCGSGLIGLALIMCVIITVALLIFDRFPVKRAPYLLVVNSEDMEIEPKVIDVVQKHTRHFTIKSKNKTKHGIDLIFEIRTNDQQLLFDELNKIEELANVSLLAHDGETRF